MGFFTFLLADTGEKILNDTECHIIPSNSKYLTVYYYDGYGRFNTNQGTIDIHEWLAKENYPNLELNDEEMRNLGIYLQNPDEPCCYRDLKGRLYTVLPVSTAKQLGIEPVLQITDFGAEVKLQNVLASFNDHIESERLLPHSLEVPFPLKIAKVPQSYSKLSKSIRTF
ncbi:hypothetical protein ACPV5U_19340 [Vibrio mediterranei]